MNLKLTKKKIRHQTNHKLEIQTGISFTFDQELFTKLDQNADGLVSQEEFVAIIKKDKSLLDVLHGKQM